MAREHNYLLGSGERLATAVKISKGGGDKNPPYTFQQARERLSERLATTVRDFTLLPRDAKPKGQVVALLTMHPRYVSKSDYPLELLAEVGLRSVGSRSALVKPDAWGVEKHPESALSDQIFVAGKDEAFSRWIEKLRTWSGRQAFSEQIQHVETLEAYKATDKLHGFDGTDRVGVLEVVLHNAGDRAIIEAFEAYARAHGAEVLMDRARDVRGLTFIPVQIAFSAVEDLVRFAFVRVARAMPSLRPIQSPVTRSLGQAIQLPTHECADNSFRAVIFDGGLPSSAKTALDKWVTLIEPSDIGKPVPAFQEHGLAVTSALLFGPLAKGDPPSQPICKVDHVRVLDENAGNALEYVDVLDRILRHLDNNPTRYQFVNISLGPNTPSVDDEVTYWTAALDQRFAHGRVLATVAVGNDGEADQASKLNRIQPPADGVNVLAVGAATLDGPGWSRSPYSCIGPGRSPGFVKPDGVVFGGCDEEPFGVLAAGSVLVLEHTFGTSLSSPYALRSATAVRAQLADALSPLAIRALLIHRAEPGDHPRDEVGWGRFESDPERLITCDDDEAVVIYQGVLPIGEHLRARIAMPKAGMMGDVFLTATLVIAPEVDPEHASAYTRAGLEVSFRPDKDRFSVDKKGKQSKHPKAGSFYSAANLYHSPEYQLRAEDFKWEPCRRNTQKFDAAKLNEPLFDIYYHSRENAVKAQLPDPIPYAFIVGVRAPEVRDLYNRIVRAYSSVLVPLRPQLRIAVRR
jgi:hypothetical protein